ncbi:hypothetical protein [Sinorhizobium psoraleae]|uniref:Transposase n=1 Tax=Sinorhizobium psoraleae TaxID=520838 RepID=A0ABT4KK76_9HYPH|nr:hypothetical protein [Sinorhizobium psoraleae]MCZ4092365.1 hypothetical protein [Sinorhizobium psoraleae]
MKPFERAGNGTHCRLHRLGELELLDPAHGFIDALRAFRLRSEFLDQVVGRQKRVFGRLSIPFQSPVKAFHDIGEVASLLLCCHHIRDQR